MKLYKLSKILTTIFLCTAFVGCASSSIGIIGGADGPTEIIVAEKEEITMYLISGCLLGHNCKYNGGNNRR